MLFTLDCLTVSVCGLAEGVSGAYVLCITCVPCLPPCRECPLAYHFPAFCMTPCHPFPQGAFQGHSCYSRELQAAYSDACYCQCGLSVLPPPHLRFPTLRHTRDFIVYITLVSQSASSDGQTAALDSQCILHYLVFSLNLQFGMC